MNSVDSMSILKIILLAGALIVGTVLSIISALNVLFRELEKAEEDGI
jgi:hypothetical protein